MLIDASRSLPDEEAELTLQKENLHRVLDKLSTRQRQILELRYGLDGQEPQTLEEVGRVFGVTRERIRQLENQSLKVLRKLAMSQPLGREKRRPDPAARRAGKARMRAFPAVEFRRAG